MAPMPRSAAARFHHTPSIHWLSLCPLLPACTGPVTGMTLMLAAVLTASAAALGTRLLHRPRDGHPDVLTAPIIAAGMAGLIDLGLHAGAPSLHAQIGAALPWLVLTGLIGAGGADQASTRTTRLALAALAGLALATLNATVKPGLLAHEFALLPGSPNADPILTGGIPWLSPAETLIGLALLLAAVNATRTATGNGTAE